MAANSVAAPFAIITDTDGFPLNNGYVYIGTAGSNPETSAITTYWDVGLVYTAAQPIRTINGYLSRNGSPGILFVNADDYSITVKDKHGALVYTALNANERIPFAIVTGQIGSDQVDHIAQFSGIVTRTAESKLEDVFDVRDYGAVGDDTDETTKIINALTAAAGATLTFETGKVYRVTDALVVQANTTLNLNGSKIKFVTVGTKKNLDLRDGVKVLNGHIENAGSSFSGDGSYQSPINIGHYGVGTGYQNIVLENLIVEGARPNGNGINITGDSNNLTINNINFPSSVNLERPILVHWGGGADPTAGTTHPHNISITNIKLGTMTGAGVGAACIYISGCYGINIENVYADDIRFRGGMLTTFAGDHGGYYGGAAGELVMQGITAKNIGCGVTTQNIIKIDNRSVLDPATSIYAGPTIIGAFGVNSGTTIASIIVANCKGARIVDARIKGGSVCLAFGESVTGAVISGGVFEGGYTNCIQCTNGTVAPEDCIIENVRAFDAAENAGSEAIIYVGIAKRITIQNCSLGNLAGEAATWGIVAAAGSAEDLDLIGNHVYDAVGSAYSIGSGGVYGQVKTFIGNTSETGVQNQSGSNPMVFLTYARAAGVARQAFGSAAPTAGTWNNGDIVWKTDPFAGGIIGWVCVTAGTPGTWKTFGVISA